MISAAANLRRIERSPYLTREFPEGPQRLTELLRVTPPESTDALPRACRNNPHEAYDRALRRHTYFRWTEPVRDVVGTAALVGAVGVNTVYVNPWIAQHVAGLAKIMGNGTIPWLISTGLWAILSVVMLGSAGIEVSKLLRGKPLLAETNQPTNREPLSTSSQVINYGLIRPVVFGPNVSTLPALALVHLLNLAPTRHFARWEKMRTQAHALQRFSLVQGAEAAITRDQPLVAAQALHRLQAMDTAPETVDAEHLEITSITAAELYLRAKRDADASRVLQEASTRLFMGVDNGAVSPSAHRLRFLAAYVGKQYEGEPLRTLHPSWAALLTTPQDFLRHLCFVLHPTYIGEGLTLPRRLGEVLSFIDDPATLLGFDVDSTDATASESGLLDDPERS